MSAQQKHLNAPRPKSPSQSQSCFDALPRCIVTSSILPFATCDDWLQFRSASRGCHQILHDRDTTGIESVWRLALVRDYGFEFEEEENAADGNEFQYRSIRSPVRPRSVEQAFLSTDGLFVTSDPFAAWKHWRKIDLRLRQESGRYAFLVCQINM